MAWKVPQIRPRPLKHNNGWKIHFSFDGKQFKRYVGNDEETAYRLQIRLNSIATELKCGLIDLPGNLSVEDFIFSQIIPSLNPQTSLYEPVNTLTKLIDKYIESTKALKEKAHNTIHCEIIHLNHLRKFIQHKRYDPFLEDIGISFFNDYKCYRKNQHVLNKTINKELGTYQQMFGYAVENELLKSNVVRDVKRAKKEKNHSYKAHSEVLRLLEKDDYCETKVKELKRYRYFTCEELLRLFELTANHYSEDHWIFPILITFAYTGIRQSELLRLQWTDIDFEQSTLTARSKKQSKSDQEKERVIDMAPTLKQVLQKQRSKVIQTSLVFPGPNGGELSKHTLRSSFKKIIKNTEFEGIGFHEFRHSFATNLALSKVELWILARIMGHTTESVRDLYIHLPDERRKNAIYGIWGDK